MASQTVATLYQCLSRALSSDMTLACGTCGYSACDVKFRWHRPPFVWVQLLQQLVTSSATSFISYVCR